MPLVRRTSRHNFRDRTGLSTSLEQVMRPGCRPRHRPSSDDNRDRSAILGSRVGEGYLGKLRTDAAHIETVAELTRETAESDPSVTSQIAVLAQAVGRTNRARD